MPFFKSIYILLFFLFTAVNVSAQREYNVLDGQVKIRNTVVCKYKLFFLEKKGAISGYSLTWFADGLPRKAIVKGVFDYSKKSLAFTETEEENLLILKSNSICYFIATLTYKKAEGKTLYYGNFYSMGNYGERCGEGEMLLVQDDTTIAAIVPPPPKEIKKELVEPHFTVAKQGIAETITAGSNKEIESNTDTLTLDLWDYGNIDGDVVSVTLNGQMILSKYTLDSLKKRLKIHVNKGFNTIAIIAENEGIAPPNTARLLLTDGDKHYNLTAYNYKGKSATITIRKK